QPRGEDHGLAVLRGRPRERPAPDPQLQRSRTTRRRPGRDRPDDRHRADDTFWNPGGELPPGDRLHRVDRDRGRIAPIAPRWEPYRVLTTWYLDGHLAQDSGHPVPGTKYLRRASWGPNGGRPPSPLHRFGRLRAAR